jgi:alginate O-acetyltransferase complex protein AlgI
MRLQAGSGLYFIFLAIVFGLYWMASGSRLLRLAVLLSANYLFCARYGLFYVFLLPACSTLDYLVGLGLTRFRARAIRRILVTFSVCGNIGVLVVSRHMGAFLRTHGGSYSAWDWIFPLSVSFYALQSLTYTIDLYRRDGEASPSLLAYVTSASFFPTLQAGPITRLCDLARQVSQPPTLSRIEGGRALFLIGMGLIKKTLIADYLTQNLVNRVFDTPKLYSGAEALLAVYAYALSLYFDFSGYTDIARGSAQLLGIRLPINFDRPYLAANLPEFWRRWHISFSNWLRDYLYFSLPGKRTRFMPYLGLIITMVLGGLWHGATWTFAIWGLLHGGGLAITRLWQAGRGRRPKGSLGWRHALLVLATFHFVCLTWVFFRAASVPDAMALLSRIASLSMGFENISPVLALALTATAASLFAAKSWYGRAMEAFAQCPFYVHAAALAAVVIAIELLGGRGSAPFVYSRF